MRYRMFLLLSVVSVGILGMTTPAPSGYNTNTYNLQRVEISGVVQSVNGQEAYILTDDGEEIGVLLGPLSYWEERGYYLPVGEYVEMDVWYDPYEEFTGWYFAGEIWGPDFHFALTNNYGVPYWVIPEQDYYYGLGYRASSVSYMVWFDCPPFYFLNLYLPPPPPRYYSCYYGPRWRNYCSDWYYGPRYCSGGSYWNDGRGYERPGRRSGRRFADGREGNGGNYNPGYDNDRKLYNRAPAYPATPPSKWNAPRAKSPPRNDDKNLQPRSGKSPDRSAKPQLRKEQKSQQRVTSPRHEQKSPRKIAASQKERKYQERHTALPRNEQKYQNRVSKPAPERKLMAHKPEPQKQHQTRAVKPQQREQKYQAHSGKKPQVREQKAPVRDTKPQYSKPQQKKQDGGTKNTKRSSGGSRGQDRKNKYR